MGLGEVLEEIRSVSCESWQLTDDALASSLIEVCSAIHGFEALRYRLISDMNERGAVPSGYTGVAAWLACNTSLNTREAVRIERRADALRSSPEVRAAFEADDICADHAAMVINFMERPPAAMPAEAAPAALKFLLDAARDRDTRVLRGAVVKLKQVFETDDPPPAEDLDRNEFFASPTSNGRVLLKGDVDAETGEMLLSALSPLSKPRPTSDAEPDRRTPAQRRADAFTEVLRRYHDAACGPDEGNERPHLHVHINANDLVDKSGSGKPAADRGAYQEMFAATDVGWTPWMGPLSVDTVRRLACDCTLSPILLDENGTPIDLGRTTKVISRKLRRALVARDHGCAFPGCGRPPSWCDGHHVKHWADGGPTDLDNLVLLCRFHHRMIHHSGWQVVMGEDRHPWFIPPVQRDRFREPIPANNRGAPVPA
ncbi:HNH endonuclease signature motif containing protein [Antrihabitans cavernicola]|uniref:DUF222 domain-containing protein n=1 Tax=Antrihabitans cavernicola TaxID=2495913 RepID=A0A5A7SCU6_9NOCA|nr:HNH endonuclease signature motif containing protein [Spelaeibacter cavernicola]KAA0023002.1 DUF222 domain-containing protein [Spelaeibacter cavernicola]